MEKELSGPSYHIKLCDNPVPDGKNALYCIMQDLSFGKNITDYHKWFVSNYFDRLYLVVVISLSFLIFNDTKIILFAFF